MSSSNTVSADAVMAELQERVRERLRADVLRHGASEALADPTVFAHVEELLRSAAERAHPQQLLLPELLGAPESWRLETAFRHGSHRHGAAKAIILFTKRRILMPALRWLFEYSRDNFERQQRVNHVLFACVQELAVDNARLRQELQQLRSTR